MNDDEFRAAFEAAAIPAERWKHRDHVRVAFLYLRELHFEHALAHLRAGIRTLNVANGGQNTESSGYHETVTVAWARLVAAAIEPDGALDFEAFAARNPHLLDKDALRAHYSRERMLSVEARTSYVEPDLAPLPAPAERRLAAEMAVHVEPYDARWPEQFERERAQLASTLQPWLAGPIEHVGSTAVPGLVAKPVIDIMAGVTALASSRAAIMALSAAGYRYSPYRADVMHWLCKPSFAHRTHHLHLVPYGSALWKERLAFRDHLRANADAAAEYAALKTRLASTLEHDREAYTEAKGPFVAKIVRAALDR